MEKDVIQEKKTLRYVLAHEQIKEMIKEQGLKKGDKLPSENELATVLGISRGTLRQALMLLRESGIIYNHQGKGNFICGTEQASEGLERASCDIIQFATEHVDHRQMTVEYGLSTKSVQESLELSETTLMAQFCIQYFSAGQVIAYRIFFIPFESVNEANVLLEQEEDMLKFVDDCLQTRAAKTWSTFSCIEAREDVTENMMVPSGTRILYFSEVIRDKTARALAFEKVYCHPDYFHFTINRE